MADFIQKKVPVLRIWMMTVVMITAPAVGFAQDQFQLKVDKSFADGSLVWGGSIGKGYDARIKLIVDKKGHLALCGIGRTTKIQLSDAINTALRGGTVKVNGKTVIENFRFFSKARRKADLNSGTATCKSSGVPAPRDAKAIRFSYGNGTFRN